MSLPSTSTVRTRSYAPAVLVLGASGGVGNAAVQLAAKAGAWVLGTGTNPDMLAKLRVYGLTEPLVTKD